MAKQLQPLPAEGAPAVVVKGASHHASGPQGVHPEGLTTAQAEILQEEVGYNEVTSKQVPEWQKIMWRYLDWVCIVIMAAAIISVAVPNNGSRGWTSFALLLIELNLVVWVGWWTDRNAGNAIKELQELAAPSAMCLRDGKWSEIPVRELVPGDVVELKGGDIIPADCTLVGQGEPMKIDESSLTGESMAVTKRPGDAVLAGAVVAAGELAAQVTATGANTFFGKTMLLLARPKETGHLQKVLGRVSIALGIIGAVGVLTVFSVLVAVDDAGVGYALVTAFVIYVSVVPIGMPVVVGAVLAVGARKMAKEKAIVSRLSALEELSGMEVLCSDKTGTLTLNRLTLDKADIQTWGDYTADDVILLAALSAKWSNQDAIDRAVTAAAGGDKDAALAGWRLTRLVPFNPVDKKTLAEAVAPDGKALSTAKGAPQVIRDMLPAGAAAARAAVDAYIAERASRGLRSLGIAASLDGGASWTLVGLLSLLDPPREDSADTIRTCRHELGVTVKMVTGDQHAIAVETSRRLGLGTDIMDGSELMGLEGAKGIDAELAARVDRVDGFAGVYPEHKFLIVEALQARGVLVGMTGDGVNDAPALKRANVGIAVAGATPAAKGAADIVLTEEGIGTIVTAIHASRRIFRRLQTYIIYRMASSLMILGFFFLAILILDFEFPTWTLVLISLTNDLSVMATSFDHVHSSALPEIWNMTRCLVVAVALAAVGVGSSMLLLLLCTSLDWWGAWDVTLVPNPGPGTVNPQTVSVMYLALTLFIQLQILLTRNPSFWWRFAPHSAPAPAPALVLPVLAFCVGSTFLAVYWPIGVQPDGGNAALQGAGWVPALVAWLWVLVWLQVADLAKYGVQRVYRRYDVVKEEAKHSGAELPQWVRTLDAPGDFCDGAADWLEARLASCLACCRTGPASPATH